MSRLNRLITSNRARFSTHDLPSAFDSVSKRCGIGDFPYEQMLTLKRKMPRLGHRILCSTTASPAPHQPLNVMSYVVICSLAAMPVAPRRNGTLQWNDAKPPALKPSLWNTHALIPGFSSLPFANSSIVLSSNSRTQKAHRY